MTYTANTVEVVVENGSAVAYKNDTDSIGIVLQDLNTDFNCTVRLTLNEYTTEESSTSITFQQGMYHLVLRV
jgi:hypothetical protein